MINYLAGFSNFMTCCYDEAALKSAKIEYIMVVRNFVPISKRNTRNQLKFDSMTSILNNKKQSEFRCRTYNVCFKITKIYSAFFLAKQQQTLTFRLLYNYIKIQNHLFLFIWKIMKWLIPCICIRIRIYIK